ncbi:unnamed protein product [Effrenium voratum]|uniref:Uncharacterized protein n=1 Tax=Effrenium voratum TaxID=2562239 RepID=A0AA36I3J0_9DINO|nr:unnamed protein product [Effrenium voratum]CAJ1420760.1 unnamed protein product [Effrenium voratum]
MNDLPRGMGLDPILVRQPDGSLAEGRPAGLADSPVLATPPTPPRGFLAAELAEQAMQGSRRVLICILLSSFFVEIALAGERPSVPPTKWHARRAMLALQLNIAYGALYYALGLQAIYYSRSGLLFRVDGQGIREATHFQQLERLLRRLAYAALLGAALQPLLALLAGHSGVSLAFLRVAAYSQAHDCLLNVRHACAASRSLVNELSAERESSGRIRRFSTDSWA